MIRVLSFLLTLLVLNSCQQSERPQAEADFRDFVSQALEHHAQAALSRNVPEAASIFSDDAILMFPNSPNVQGRDSIADLMRRSWPQANPTQLRYTTDEIFLSSDFAASVNRYWLTIQPSGKGIVQDSGRYLFLWKRQAEGPWRIHRAIANTLVPPGK